MNQTQKMVNSWGMNGGGKKVKNKINKSTHTSQASLISLEYPIFSPKATVRFPPHSLQATAENRDFRHLLWPNLHEAPFFVAVCVVCFTNILPHQVQFSSGSALVVLFIWQWHIVMTSMKICGTWISWSCSLTVSRQHVFWYIFNLQFRQLLIGTFTLPADLGC